MLTKRDRIIDSIRKQQNSYVKKSHKFCMEHCKTVEQAYAMEAKNDNTLWAER